MPSVPPACSLRTPASVATATESEWRALLDAAAAHERAGRLRVRVGCGVTANAGEAEDLAQVAAPARSLMRSRPLTPELRHLAATGEALRAPWPDSKWCGWASAPGLSPFDDAIFADPEV
jgi:alanine racemase